MQVQLKIILIILFFGSTCPIFSQSQIKQIKITQCKTPPKIDGVIEEKCWQACAKLGNFSVYPTQSLALNQSFGYVTYDEENLYIAIIAEDLAVDKLVASVGSVYDSKEIFNDDTVEVFIWPSEFHERYIQLVFNPNGACTDILWDITTGKGDYGWNSDLKYSVGRIKGAGSAWTVEMSIPLNKLNLSDCIKNSFRFNICRQRMIRNGAIALDGKNGTKKSGKVVAFGEESGWSPVGKNFQNPLLFGSLIGEHGNEKLKAQVHELEQKRFLDTAASLVSSMDVYFKAINNFDQLIPEGCEVTHGASIFENNDVPVAQYLAKADGYMRFYLKTGIKEYKNLSEQILLKIEKIYKSTKDVNGKPWFPLVSLVDDSGNAHGYDKGPINARNFPQKIPWDQSKAKVVTKNNAFCDAFGMGLLDLSKLVRNLSGDNKNLLVEICEVFLEFYHQDYVLKEEKGIYYWRTDDFFPENPKLPIPEPIWGVLGQDIIYVIMAYSNLEGKNSDRYLQSAEKFAEYYMKNRMNLGQRTLANAYNSRSAFWRIEFLDNRMLTFAEFLKSKNRPIGHLLSDWLLLNLPQQYTEIPPTRPALDGKTVTSDSTVPMIEIFRRLDKEKFKILWQNYTDYDLNMRGFGYMGIISPAINFSSYPVFLDYGYKAWNNRLISNQELVRVTKRFYNLFGHPSFLRNNDSWCQDVIRRDKNLPEWQAVPDSCYVENVMPEGLWKNGESQGYTKTWGGGASKKTDYENLDFLYSRNIYYQFCAPFQTHSTPFSYGIAFDFNLLYTEPKVEEINVNTQLVSIECKKNNLPSNLPCYGVVDVTDAYYIDKCFYKPTWNKVIKVTFNNQPIPFKEIKILEYYRVGSPLDNVKIVFVVPEADSGDFQVKFYFEKKEKIFLDDRK